MQRKGVRVYHQEVHKDRGVVKLEDGQETGKSLSQLLQVTETRAEGIIKGMPPVGQWRSHDRRTYYVAFGTIVDRDGNPVSMPDDSESPKP